MWDLKNKKALITGGTKGIGKATVEEFISLGAEVLFTARNADEVKELQKAFSEKDGAVITGLAADATNDDDNKAVKTWIEKNWGKLDVLVNNAGMNIRKLTNEYTIEEYHKVMNTNMTAPFLLSNLLFDLLKKSGSAAIINVASVAGTLDVKTGSPYGISKAGLIQFTKHLAVEWAAYGIRVNTVSPWFTETPLTKGLLSNQEKSGQIINRTPLGRIAKPVEMAAAIAFLAMPAASYITGQNLIVDGGMTASAL